MVFYIYTELQFFTGTGGTCGDRYQIKPATGDRYLTCDLPGDRYLACDLPGDRYHPKKVEKIVLACIIAN